MRAPAVAALLLLLIAPLPASSETFDHRHAAWTAILTKHQAWRADGHRSSFDYAAARTDQGAIDAYLATLGAVERGTFENWSRDQQLAFLLNLYNAAAIARVLDADELPASIRDLGSFFRPVWKQESFELFGEPSSLDHVEHGILRKRYDEPLIHAGLVCASCSCPPLRDEAYRAEDVGEQLRDTMRRFLSDRGRNRVDPSEERVELSKIFDWFAEDFEDGDGNIRPYLLGWADALAATAEERAVLERGAYRLRYLDYDWSLNAPGNCR